MSYSYDRTKVADAENEFGVAVYMDDTTSKKEGDAVLVRGKARFVVHQGKWDSGRLMGNLKGVSFSAKIQMTSGKATVSDITAPDAIYKLLLEGYLQRTAKDFF